MIRKTVKDGEWIRPKMDGYLFECCGDCQKTRRLSFRVSEDGGIESRGWKNDDEWVALKMTAHFDECDRCGLLHRMNFRVSEDGTGIEMQGWRIRTGFGDGLNPDQR